MSPRSWPTQEQRPSRWAGPSFVLDVVSRGRRCLALGGYRWRLAVWEGRLTGRGQRVRLPWGGRGLAYGDVSLLSDDPDTWESVELEVVLGHARDGGGEMEDCHRALTMVFAPSAPQLDLTPAWSEIPAVGSLPIAANRDLAAPKALRAAGITVGDLRFTELPSRQGDPARPIAFASRWVRLIRGSRSLGAIWHPTEGCWAANEVRWPHGAIPSRSVGWYTGPGAASPVDRLVSFLHDAISHEVYYATGFTNELDLWEQQIYRAMADGSASFRAFDLPGAERELGRLAEYIAAAAFDHRALVRRAAESRIFQDMSVQAEMTTGAGRVEEVVHPQRQRIREAFALLAAATSAHQLREAEQARKLGQALQDRIVFITTVVIVPALIASIYSSDVRQLGNGYKGSLPALITYMFAGAIVAGSVVRGWFRTHGSGGQRRPWRLLVAILLPSAAWLVYLDASGNAIPLIVGAAALVASGALAMA